MILRIFLTILFLGASIFIYINLDRFTYLQKIEPNIEQELRKKATKSFLEDKINKALNKNNLGDAKEYIELSNYLNIELNSTLIKTYSTKENSLENRLNHLKDFATGFIGGDASNSYSLAGSITSDFTLVGDIRDLYKEGNKYLNNQDYDKFILTLSIIGTGLGISTITSFGATAPLKAGASILKVAKRSKFLTKNFQVLLIKRLNKSVDLSILKKVDISSFNSIKKNTKKFINSINLKPIKPFLNNINSVYKNSSLIATLKTLKYIENEKELQKVVKISKKFKNHTPTVLKILGKSAFRGAKFVLKKTKEFFIAIIVAIFSFLMFLVNLFLFLKKLLKKR